MPSGRSEVLSVIYALLSGECGPKNEVAGSLMRNYISPTMKSKCVVCACFFIISILGTSLHLSVQQVGELKWVNSSG